MLPALPQVHSWDDAIAHSDLAYRHPGRRVLIEGVYEIDPIPTAQGARFVWIRMADGSGVLRAEDVVASEIGGTTARRSSALRARGFQLAASSVTARTTRVRPAQSRPHTSRIDRLQQAEPTPAPPA